MTDRDRTFYDELGVAPDASVETLRASYRQRARQLHPDVAPGDDAGDAMRRLNQAWAVLGDGERRREYDEGLASSAPRSSAPSVAPPPVSPPPPVAADPLPRRIPFLRPSALILMALAALFVVTAYAGSWPGKPGGPPTSTPTTAPGPGAVHPVGQCLAIADAIADAGASGLHTIVPCTQPNTGQILAEVTAVEQCPTGTVGRLWTLRPTVLCTTLPPAP